MFRPSFVPLVALLAACTDTKNPTEVNENEVITTVVLTFSPDGGGDDLVATWEDPENDGSPLIDDVELALGTTYAVTVEFLNALEDPPEDITLEVDEESDQHQVFFLGSAVGPTVTVTYDDTDVNGFPVGLATTVSADAAGSGELQVVLRHLPPENDAAVKVAGLADVAATDGISALPGDTDADVTFPLTVVE